MHSSNYHFWSKSRSVPSITLLGIAIEMQYVDVIQSCMFITFTSGSQSVWGIRVNVSELKYLSACISLHWTLLCLDFSTLIIEENVREPWSVAQSRLQPLVRGNAEIHNDINIYSNISLFLTDSFSEKKLDRLIQKDWFVKVNCNKSLAV